MYTQLSLGGVETLMARMASWLTRVGESVVVIVEKGGGGLSLLQPVATVSIIGDNFEELKVRGIRYQKRIWSEIFAGEWPDCVVAFSGESLWVAAGIVNVAPFPTTLLAGAWNPWEYSSSGPLSLLKNPSAVLFQKELSAQMRIYMSSGVRRSIETLARRKMDGHIWPLPIDIKRFSNVARSPVFGKIVSIGRLADIKTYNFYMIHVIKSLAEKNLSVHWDVYGDGPQRGAIQSAINAAGMENLIHLKGALPYSDMEKVLTEAYVFVGMGTALIEAGAGGVPCIPVIANIHIPVTYGYLYEMPEYFCGEEINGRARLAIEDLLLRLLTLPPIEYAREGALTARHVERFDLDVLMKKFVSIAAGAAPILNIWRPGILYRCSILARYLNGAVNACRRW